MPGSLIKKERRQLLHKLIKDDSFWEQMFEEMGEGKSLSELCKDLKWCGLPGKNVPYTSVWVAIDVRSDLSDRYARAKSARVDGLSHKVLKIADDVVNGVMDPQAGRVAADQYKWAASKFYPKMFGDKIQADVQVTNLTQIHLNEVRDYAKGKAKVINPVGDKLLGEPREERHQGDEPEKEGYLDPEILEAMNLGTETPQATGEGGGTELTPQTSSKKK
tara:strand:- start:2700 stop:3356 length:657 start_codon:yes stop_codon:yes gene_type:complete